MKIKLLLVLLGIACSFSFSAEEKLHKKLQKECVDALGDFFEKKTARRACTCVYDELKNSPDYLAIVKTALDEEGDVEDFEDWGMAFLKKCIPTKFSKETEKIWNRECGEHWNKAECQCAYGVLVNEYSVEAYVKKALENEEKFEKITRDWVILCDPKTP